MRNFNPIAIASTEKMAQDYEIKNDKRLKQLTYVSHVICQYSTPRDLFNVLDPECTAGKSVIVCYTIAELYLKTRETTGTVIVKNFDLEVNQTVNRINQLTAERTAIGISASNWKDERSNLDQYHTVVITHSRYWQLLKNKELDKFLKFYRGIERRNFIVDEYCDLAKKKSFGVQKPEKLSKPVPEEFEYLDELSKLLDREPRKDFDLLIEPIVKEVSLHRHEEKKMFFAKFQFNKVLFNRVKSLVKANFKGASGVSKNQFLNRLEDISLLLRYGGVINNNTISFCDPSVRYMGFSNNIILDANGGFDHKYALNEKLKVIPQGNFRDFSQAKIYMYRVNSSKNGIKKAINYFKECGKLMAKHVGNNDKALVVIHKEFMDASDFEQHILPLTKNHSISVDWYGNLQGKNDYGNFNKVFILGTPRNNSVDYVLQYHYHTLKPINKQRTLRMVGNGETYAFKNRDMDKLRITQSAGDIYQAILRIDRNRESFTGEIFLMCKDSDVEKLILKQFKGNIKKITKSLDIKYDKDAPPKPEDYPTKLIQLVSQLVSGVYKKKWLREQIGYSDSKKFNERVLKHADVLSYFKARGIKTVYHDIIIP